MRYVFRSAVFWMVVGVFLVQNTAPSGTVRGQTSQARLSSVPRSMQLTATVIGQEYCRNAATQESQTNLKLKLSVKNISDATLIVSRFGNAINRVVLSRSLRKAQSGDYVYDERTTFMRLPSLQQIDIQQVSPTVEFVTLKPGESFNYEYPQSIDITLTDADDPSQNVSPGQYFIQVKIRTWQWDSDKIKPLEQRWVRYGSLWYRDITSQPLAISIDQPSSTTPVCK